MKYTPDLKYEKSIKLVDYLTKDKPLPRSYDPISEEEMLDLLLYHIEKKDEHINLQRERIKEYQSVFDGISKFTTKRTAVYGN